MNKLSKVKKTIEKEQINNLILGNHYLINKEDGELVDLKVKTSKYKLKLSNNKKFMKKWTDRALNLKIKKDLSLLEKELLFDIIDYIDDNNIINLKLLANDFGYSPSKISKAKKQLEEKEIIKKYKGLLYLNPIIGIKTKEINQELIEIFENSFIKYGIEINYK